MKEDENFTISVTWGVEDVQSQAKEEDIEVSVKEAISILKNIKREHDAEFGINWAEIRSKIYDLDMGRESTSHFKTKV